MKQSDIAYECSMGSETTVVNWCSYLRGNFKTIMTKLVPSQKIGGPGMWVEIDETHIRLRKYDRGRVLKSQEVRIFGGICHATKKIFIKVLKVSFS